MKIEELKALLDKAKRLDIETISELYMYLTFIQNEYHFKTIKDLLIYMESQINEEGEQVKTEKYWFEYSQICSSIYMFEVHSGNKRSIIYASTDEMEAIADDLVAKGYEKVKSVQLLTATEQQK